MAGWKFYIETYGCRVNQYESEKLRKAWLERGGKEAQDPAAADYILINSCAITGRAERNARNAVARLKRLNPRAQLILTGCAAQFYADFRPRRNSHFVLPDHCEPQQRKASLLTFPESENTRKESVASKRSRPILKIQDGCSQCCAFCIVPQTRGAPTSRPREEILAEAREYANSGYGELVLSGINLRQYADRGDFWDLLQWLDRELSGEFSGRLRLRISSLDPAMLDFRAIEILADTKLVTPHLHLSMQHASSSILKAMRRSHYQIQTVRKMLEELGQVWPVFGLGADFLVGFPGETDSDLIILEQFIEQAPFSYAHVFPYSRRQGTVAARLPEQAPKSEKDKRAKRIRELIAKKNSSFLADQLQIGEMRVILDAPQEKGMRRGVNEFYVPCRYAGDSIQYAVGILKARPTGVGDHFLEVEIIGSC